MMYIRKHCGAVSYFIETKSNGDVDKKSDSETKHFNQPPKISCNEWGEQFWKSVVKIQQSV